MARTQADGQQPKKSRRGNDRQQSIKRRVIRLVLIPGVAALALWLAASGYLVFQGFYNRQVAVGVREVSIPAVPALASIQEERRLGIAYLAQSDNDLQELLDQRRQTDEQLTALRTVAEGSLAAAPDSIITQWNTLTGYLDQLPSIRTTIDSRSASGQEAYEFYNGLLDAATEMFDIQARIVPDVTAAQGGIAATEAFLSSDLMSRAGSLGDEAFSSRSFTEQEHLAFVQLVGAYRATLAAVSPHLHPDAQQRYEEIVASDAWQRLQIAEDKLIAAGAWGNSVPGGLGIDRAQWAQLTAQVSADLVDLTIVQADSVSAQTLRTGNNQLLLALLGSLLALAVAVAATVWAVRQSQVLVDQALSLRLAQLGQDASAMVDERLPAVMDRLRRREQVDLSAELATKDYGADEIGQVAQVINRSLQAAAAAAVNEAQTRTSSITMLMGVARRPQRPLQRGLRVIEDLQGRIGDEKLLGELFDINHQLTQTRRFLENLVILAGGQIGRRFKNPVPVRRVLLAAFAESQHYQRITLRKAADLAVHGHAVAGTIHLLAELLDNALAFSPPETMVWVTCNEVKHGLAVEIEDAGMGMRGEALDRANDLLATAPTPDVMALRDGAQVGLHVVAELAKRDGIQVSLRTSAYGGLLAIVLLPERLLAGRTDDRTGRDLEQERLVPAMAGAVARPNALRHHPRAAANAATATATATAPAQASATATAPAHPQAPSATPVPTTVGTTGAAATNAVATAAAPGSTVGPAPVIPGPASTAGSAPVGGGTVYERRSTGDVAGHPYRTGDPADYRRNGAAQVEWRLDPEPAEPDPAAGGGTTATGTPPSAPPARPPLPHRQPQQHIAPELRDEIAADGDPGTDATPMRSPEEARNRFSRYQRAWSAGQAAASDDVAANDAPATNDDQGRNA
ncbi:MULTISPECIES: nitrate- and nitrite sensing domain-containing protein [unclassified Solwaraspora]|uniref:sensor histidine kinase n=1 Tax=unclassified Solwaraspora TaxID=2627926 RepID=UPI00259BDEAF|nr:nitrate- and nitrite sensing domain-containing protein [Solwaraspora sp. WMMA2056]WJK42097.1 nitrate- and nitrite sensing domain-containing protein [Solwaraspora sp. WMMA2056]